MEEHSKNEARAYALKLLSLRNHSRFELQEKLRKKGFGKEAADTTMDWLTGKKLIDDKAFGKELIGILSKRKPSGERALRYELIRRGVPEETASELLKAYDSQESCIRAGMKKLASMKGSDNTEQKKKLEVFLHNRGFEWPAIKETTRRLFLAGPEEKANDDP